MDPKNIIASKTLWLNLVALVAMIVQTQTGFVIDAEQQAAILTVLNLILRLFTRQPVSWR